MKLISVETLAGMYTQSQGKGSPASLMTYFNGVEIQKYKHTKAKINTQTKPSSTKASLRGKRQPPLTFQSGWCSSC